ncbi:bile acid:sodium symporter family protein [Halobacillus andaensis]|uniref:bile acid:sodium symporter family protein n=1 Tax=Halobacillus andaensis TaxID=1176239 RepID=UPI003D749280
MNKLNTHLSKLLPIYITCAALFSFVVPQIFSPIYHWTSFLLGFVIFLTGLSMSFKDLYILKKSALIIGVGLTLKWTLTVIVSIVLAKIFFSAQPNLLAGLILTGSVPSGTAATMYTFLAGGSTSLVVAMGITDVFISPILTPMIMNMAANYSVVVSFLNLSIKMFFIVILPIVLGMLLRHFGEGYISRGWPYAKLLSSFTLILIVLSVVAGITEQVTIQSSELILLVVIVFIQVFLPMVAGFGIARLLGFRREDSIAILFEVGLCNSALAAILALEFFGDESALPAVINMIINLSLGAYFSTLFSRKIKEKSKNLRNF